MPRGIGAADFIRGWFGSTRFGATGNESDMRAQAATTAAGVLLSLGLVSPAAAQLRVAQWNITNFTAGGAGDREAAFKTALYGVYEGRSLAPDVLIVEEVFEGEASFAAQQAAGDQSVAVFLGYLNTAPGSPGDWAAAPYVVNGGDTGNALFYRTSKVRWLGTATLSAGTGGPPSGAPRDNQRYRLRLVGYSGTGPGAELYAYAAHYKSGSTGEEQNRRKPESARIRADANSLPVGANFLIGADFNVQSSAQIAYQYLVSTVGSPGPGEEFWSNPAGRFFDPINKPGAWENSALFDTVHTQEPGTQMDSRHDQILVGASLRDGQGMDYMPGTPGGSITAPYSSGTWDDPNHSYRAWGNDGDTFEGSILANANTMVGAVIAQALIDSTAGNGHLPVYLDLRVPARLGAPSTVGFGAVAQGAPAQVAVQVSNAADLARFSRDGTANGIDALSYTLAVTAGFSLPGGTGPFSDTALPGVNTHALAVDTSTAGVKTGTLTITSDDPDSPTRVIPISATVGSPFDYDVNNDGSVDVNDAYSWFGLFTDVNGSGVVDASDLRALYDELRRLEGADTTGGRR